MKKRVVSGVVTATLLGGALLSPCYAADITADGMSVLYNHTDNTFTITGEVTKDVREWINIVIVPGEAGGVLPETLIGNENVVMKSVQTDKKGDIDLLIDLSDNVMTYQRYTYYVYPKNDTVKGYFFKIDADKLTKLTSDINGAKSIEELKAILAVASADMKLDGEAASNKEFMAKYFLAAKPENGFSEAGIIKTYFIAEGLDTTKSDFSLGKLLEEYTQYVGQDYLKEFESLDSTVAAKFSALFAANRSGVIFEKAYNDNLFVAKCLCSQSSAEMQKIMLAYITENKIDCSDYNGIGNSVYKEKVFENLYKSRSTVTDLDDLLSKFSAESKAQKKAESDSGNESGSNSTQSGGGSNVIKPNTGSNMAPPSASNNNTNKDNAAEPEQKPNDGKYVFTDTDGHWAEDYISKLYEMKIVDGREDGSFGVDEPITRAEFAKMIVSWLKLNRVNAVEFGDVDKNSWYYEFVAAAAENALINGDNGNFRPDDAITREDAAVILSRAFADWNGGEAKTEFADLQDISDYAAEAVAKLSAAGIMNGYDNNTFAPKNNITRAEAAKIIVIANEIFG